MTNCRHLIVLSLLAGCAAPTAQNDEDKNFWNESVEDLQGTWYGEIAEAGYCAAIFDTASLEELDPSDASTGTIDQATYRHRYQVRLRCQPFAPSQMAWSFGVELWSYPELAVLYMVDVEPAAGGPFARYEENLFGPDELIIHDLDLEWIASLVLNRVDCDSVTGELAERACSDKSTRASLGIPAPPTHLATRPGEIRLDTSVGRGALEEGTCRADLDLDATGEDEFPHRLRIRCDYGFQANLQLHETSAFVGNDPMGSVVTYTGRGNMINGVRIREASSIEVTYRNGLRDLSAEVKLSATRTEQDSLYWEYHAIFDPS